MARTRPALHRRTAAAFAALVALTAAAPVGGQQLRIMGTITQVRPEAHGLAEDTARPRDVCPGCVEGAAVTVAVAVPRIVCVPNFDCRTGGASLEEGGRTHGIITVAGTSWPLRTAELTTFQQRAGRFTYTVQGGAGGPSSMVGVELGFEMGTRAFDTRGALVAGVHGEPVAPDYLPAGPASGRLFLSACAWESGSDSECYRPLGEVGFVIDSVRTAGGHAPAAASLVVFVGGWGDEAVGALEREYADELRARIPRSTQRTRYFRWYQQAAIEAAVLEFRAASPEARIAIVGHSMGGHTAYETARALEGRAAVDLLVTLDPVTRGGDHQTREYPSERDLPPRPVPLTPRPGSVRRWINVWPDAGATRSLDPCKWILGYSGRWRARAEADTDLPGGTDHCTVDQMLDDVPCVRASLDALARGEPVAGSCPRAPRASPGTAKPRRGAADAVPDGAAGIVDR